MAFGSELTRQHAATTIIESCIELGPHAQRGSITTVSWQKSPRARMNDDASKLSAQQPGDARAAFLAAMRKVAATISLVTTRENGSAHGMTATAISSLSADPPAILVCIKRSASIHGPLCRVKWFCVNLLGEQHDFAAGTTSRSRLCSRNSPLGKEPAGLRSANGPTALIGYRVSRMPRRL